MNDLSEPFMNVFYFGGLDINVSFISVQLHMDLVHIIWGFVIKIISNYPKTTIIYHGLLMSNYACNRHDLA